MSRRGFALLAVLWLITALSVLAASGLVVVRQRLKGSANRITMARADWAGEACVEIMLARGFTTARDGSMTVTRTVGRVDLGRDAWCELTVLDPTTVVNLNQAGEEVLHRLLGSDSLADALLDWRDKDHIPRPHGTEEDWYRRRGRVLPRNDRFASLQEVQLVRGFEHFDEARLASLFTIRGRGLINLNRASPAVLRAALDLPQELIYLIRERNPLGRPVETVDQLVGLAPPSQRAGLAARYQDLVQRVTFAPSELVVTATGGVGSSPLRSRIALTVVPTAGRVAVIRREVE